MRILVLFFIVIINYSIVFAQNNAPEVTNVTFKQRTDGSFLVDVYYDLNDLDGDTMFVTMQVSDDSGFTWNFVSDSISGDYGAYILSDTSKHIVWDFGAEHPQTFGEAFRVSIIANDRGFESGIMTDIDGNIYKTVKIGNQWWMAEDLKVTHYCNGDTIPSETDSLIWVGLTSGSYCNYNNDVTNVDTYGILYNWYAVNDSRKIAPEGWHVPTDDEWKQLEMYLGMSQAQADSIYRRGTDEGGKLKEAGYTHWHSPNTGANNSSGFTALPGGFRNSTGIFIGMGLGASFWSSTASGGDYAWLHDLFHASSQVGRFNVKKQSGLSVRCVRD